MNRTMASLFDWRAYWWKCDAIKMGKPPKGAVIRKARTAIDNGCLLIWDEKPYG